MKKFFNELREKCSFLPSVIGPLLIMSVIFLLALAFQVISLAALFDVIGLLLGRFAPHITFPIAIQPYLTDLFTWGTITNIGVSVSLIAVTWIISFFKKEKTPSDKEYYEAISAQLDKLTNKNTSICSKIVSIIKRIFNIIRAVFLIMVDLHAIGLIFNIEQQPFVKGLFSFGSFANIFWSSLIVVIYFIAQFIKWLFYSGTLSMIDENIEMRRKIKEQQKKEAALKTVADTEQRILDRFAEFGFDADYKFKYFSMAQKKECEGTVSLFASLVSKYPKPYGTAADYLRLIEAQETPEKLLEFATLYMTGKDEDFARWGIRTNYKV